MNHRILKKRKALLIGVNFLYFNKYHEERKIFNNDGIFELKREFNSKVIYSGTLESIYKYMCDYDYLFRNQKFYNYSVLQYVVDNIPNSPIIIS